MKTMLKFKFIIINFFIFVNSYSQNLIKEITYYKPELLNTNKDYKLLVISDSGCGYCNITYEKIKDIDDKIQIIVIEFGKINDLKINKYKNFTFIHSTKIPKIVNQDFFPILYLYNKKNELIWKKEGWFESNLKKIKRKTNYH